MTDEEFVLPERLKPYVPTGDPMKIAALRDLSLSFFAAIVDDIERMRIANENRLRQLLRPSDQMDEDGIHRGFGRSADDPGVVMLSRLVKGSIQTTKVHSVLDPSEYVIGRVKEHGLADLEKAAVLTLERTLKQNPLWPAVQKMRGVGPKQGARLLAAIGDPYWNAAEDCPRSVSQLWAYCGLQVYIDGTIPKRRKGVKSNWSPNGKMRAYLIAVSAVKMLTKPCKPAGIEIEDDEAVASIDMIPTHVPADGSPCACGPYRRKYDERRRVTFTGRAEWTPGHRHNDALRLTSKLVLRDLWLAAREIHMPKYLVEERERLAAMQ